MGIRSPINFNKPFLSRDLKEFLESLAHEPFFGSVTFLYANGDGATRKKVLKS